MELLTIISAVVRAAGTPVGLIKELMRHANISTTMDVYGVGTLTPAKRAAHSALVAMALPVNF